MVEPEVESSTSLLPGGPLQKVIGYMCMISGVVLFISQFFIPHDMAITLLVVIRQWFLFPFLLIFFGLFIMVPMDIKRFRMEVVPFVKSRISVTPTQEERYIQAYQRMVYLTIFMLLVWVVVFNLMYMRLISLGASPAMGYVMVPLAAFTMGITSVVVAGKLVMWRYPDLHDIYQVEGEWVRANREIMKKKRMKNKKFNKQGNLENPAE